MTREEIEERLTKLVQEHGEYRTTDSESREREKGNQVHREERKDAWPEMATAEYVEYAEANSRQFCRVFRG